MVKIEILCSLWKKALQTCDSLNTHLTEARAYLSEKNKRKQNERRAQFMEPPLSDENFKDIEYEFRFMKAQINGRIDSESSKQQALDSYLSMLQEIYPPPTK